MLSIPKDISCEMHLERDSVSPPAKSLVSKEKPSVITLDDKVAQSYQVIKEASCLACLTLRMNAFRRPWIWSTWMKQVVHDVVMPVALEVFASRLVSDMELNSCNVLRIRFHNKSWAAFGCQMIFKWSSAENHIKVIWQPYVVQNLLWNLIPKILQHLSPMTLTTLLKGGP